MGYWEGYVAILTILVSSESISTGDCILVGHNDGSGEADTGVDLAEQWKAVVLEVRALDSEHVYLRVGWLNRPEDLDSGRKDYHGENELIPTNQMDVIDAMTVNGKINVIHWDENDLDAQILSDNQYFWRQTFDYVGSKTFSVGIFYELCEANVRLTRMQKLRQICKDNRPQNPDEMIIECSNEGCRNWLHANCIVEQAAKAAGMPSLQSYHLDVVLTTTQRKRRLGRRNRTHPRSANINQSTPLRIDLHRLPRQSKAISPQNSTSQARKALSPTRSQSSQSRRSPKSSSRTPRERSKHKICTVYVVRNQSNEERYG